MRLEGKFRSTAFYNSWQSGLSTPMLYAFNFLRLSKGCGRTVDALPCVEADVPLARLRFYTSASPGIAPNAVTIL